MAYSMTTASKGRVILQSLLIQLILAILRSSLTIVVLRYANGTSNRTQSVVYMTQWPFNTTDEDVVNSLDDFMVVILVSLFLPIAAILC